MPETTPYSNRELDLMFKTLDEKNRERHSDIMKELREIKEQTVKTNGRVGKLELWRGILTGGIIIIGTLVIPLVVYAFNIAVTKK